MLSLASRRLTRKGRVLPRLPNGLIAFPAIPSMCNFLPSERSWQIAGLSDPPPPPPPPHHVASQEALGQISPGQCPSSTIVVQPHQEEVFLEHPILDHQGRLPFQYTTLYEYQQEDPSILALPINRPQQYHVETMGGYGLVCHYHGQHNRICLTDTLLPMVVNWFHNVMAHNSGITCLQESLRFHFYHPKLLAEVHAQISRCDICQYMKRGSRQYGLLAPRDAKSAPWSDVATDCIGPWVIELRGRLEYSLCALTTFNVTTSLFEIRPILTQMAVECAWAFENGWLPHYPRSVHVFHDQGSKFMGPAFQDLLQQARIKSVPTSARNPQGNSIIEAVHKSVGQVLRTLIHIQQQKLYTKQRPWAILPWPQRCMLNEVPLTKLQHLTPCSFAFRRDMFFDLPFLTNIIALQNTQQHLVDMHLLRKNTACISHDYQVADQVLKKSILSLSDKLKPSFTGPHEITQVHMNSTVTIRLSQNVTECINIQQIKPHHS